MAIELKERPYKFCFSKNEARYEFNLTNPTSAGNSVEIRLYCHTIKSEAAPAELVAELKLYPAPDGIVRFYANTYFESILQMDIPDPETTVPVPAYNQQRYFWIEYRQVTDLAPNNAWIISERTRKRIMLLGGIEVQKYERDNYFTNYLIANKWWLTWLPSNITDGYRFVFPTQEHYITWLRTGEAGAATKLFVKVTYTDLTTIEKSFDIPDTNKSFVFHLPAGIVQLAIEPLLIDKSIYYYEVWVADDALGKLANEYRFYVDRDYYYKKFEWIYANSLGGLDAVAVKGISQQEIEREASTVSALNLGDKLNDQIKKSDSIDTGILLTKKWKADVGYTNTAGDQDGLADILASTEIFEKVDSRWLRIRLSNKTALMGASDATKWNMPLEWMYAWINNAYTPDNKVFGAGSNAGEVYDGLISSCPLPTGLNTNEEAVGMGISIMKFMWTHPGNVIATIQVKEDGATDWADTITSDFGFAYMFGFFVPDGRTMNWRLKLKCPNDDESGWVNGPDFTLSNDASACALPTGLTWTKGTPVAGVIPFTFEWAHVLPAPEFKFEYKAVGGSTWIESTVAGLTTTINFADDGTEYQWRVSAKCGVGSESPAVNGINFVASSAVTCSNPYNLSASVYSTTALTTTVRFTWDHPGAVNFMFEWDNAALGDSGSETPLVNSIDIEFPTSYYRIYWRVAAQCTIGDYSALIDGTPIYL